MKKIILTCMLMVAVSTNASAFNDGAYTMKDGTMEMTIKLMTLPDGKVFVDAMGSTKDGKNCRIGDMGQFVGNALVLGGLCSVPLTSADDGFQISATPSCVQCDQGAYIQGLYKRSVQ